MICFFRFSVLNPSANDYDAGIWFMTEWLTDWVFDLETPPTLQRVRICLCSFLKCYSDSRKIFFGIRSMRDVYKFSFQFSSLLICIWQCVMVYRLVFLLVLWPVLARFGFNWGWLVSLMIYVRFLSSCPASDALWLWFMVFLKVFPHLQHTS